MNWKNIAIVFFVSTIEVCAQQNEAEYKSLVKKADSFYTAKDYKNAANTYSKAFKSIGWKGYPNDRYNAACSWALAGVSDSAFFNLERIAKLSNYQDYESLLKDPDLNSLHGDKRWQSVTELVKQNKEKAEANLNKPLVRILDSIYNEDQTYRIQAQEFQKTHARESKEVKELWKTVHIKDSLNLIQVMAILDKYGWLGADVVGSKGNSTLFLVIQHADLKTQEKYLPMMKEAVKNGKAFGGNLALLEDRIEIRNGRKQIYGSQITMDDSNKYYVSPLIDPDNVDKRRASVGLGPLSEYVKNWDFKWDIEEYKKDLPRLESIQKKY